MGRCGSRRRPPHRHARARRRSAPDRRRGRAARRRRRSRAGTTDAASATPERPATRRMVFLRSSTPPTPGRPAAPDGRSSRARNSSSVASGAVEKRFRSTPLPTWQASRPNSRVKPIAPEAADDEQMIGRFDRAALQRAATRSSSKRIDVMHGAGEAGDQAALLQRRQRIAGNAVLRVPHVEPAMFRALEVARHIRRRAFRPSTARRDRRARRHGSRSRTACARKKPAPVGVRARTPSPSWPRRLSASPSSSACTTPPRGLVECARIATRSRYPLGSCEHLRTRTQPSSGFARKIPDRFRCRAGDDRHAAIRRERADVGCRDAAIAKARQHSRRVRARRPRAESRSSGKSAASGRAVRRRAAARASTSIAAPTLRAFRQHHRGADQPALGDVLGGAASPLSASAGSSSRSPRSRAAGASVAASQLENGSR